MKLFYFGSVCSDEIFNQTVAESKVKPSASAQNFESALIRGLSAIENLEIRSASAESIAMWPGGNRLFLKKRFDTLTDRVSTNIAPALNLPFFKQVGHAYGVGSILKKWLIENRNDTNKCVLVYGVYPSVVEKIQKLCKKYGCKCFCVVTDIPATMFTYTASKNLFKKLFGKKYRENAIKLQAAFDGYVYLTEQMSEAIAPSKPYTVVETIADTSIFNIFEKIEKSEPPVIMYAGTLYKKYGIDLIINCFKEVKSDCELWLFGSGDYEENIIAESKTNNKIKFFGRVSRDEVLKAEKQASLLLNLRNNADEYTKFSFPSKMIEYMLSGTALLTTQLEGIPAEYYSFIYSVDHNHPKEIAYLIDEILRDRNKLLQFGETAKKFVVEKKNCFVQAEKIYDFLNSILQSV